MNITVVAVLVAGGLGAASRFAVDGAVRTWLGSSFPVGTTLINVSGSFVLGLLTGLSLAHLLPAPTLLIAGTGFLGGYTTFSTASFETVRLVQERRVAAALLNGLGTLVSTTAAAALGLAIGLAA